MTKWFCLRLLRVFLTTWILYFLKTFWIVCYDKNNALQWLGMSKSRMAAMASSPLFLIYCRFDTFCVLRQSLCGKFQIVSGVWTPETPAFWNVWFTPSLTVLKTGLHLKIIATENFYIRQKSNNSIRPLPSWWRPILEICSWNVSYCCCTGTMTLQVQKCKKELFRSDGYNTSGDGRVWSSREWWTAD